MKRFDWFSADILHKRLSDNGTSPVRNYSIKKIRREGTSLGIFILIIATGLCAGTYIYGQNLLSHKKYLQSLEVEYNLLDKKYRDTLKLVNEIKQINNEVASGIAGIKSGWYAFFDKITSPIIPDRHVFNTIKDPDIWSKSEHNKGVVELQI